VAAVDERIDTDAPKSKLAISIEPSVLSVAFLCVLCLKFRKSLHMGYEESQNSRATTKNARAVHTSRRVIVRMSNDLEFARSTSPTAPVRLVPKGLTLPPLKAGGN
jgi:hypothetical protein